MTVDVPGRRDGSIPRRKFSPDEFRLAAEFMPHIVWMATPDRLIEYVNTQGTDYTGLPAADILGRKSISVVHPDDVDRVQLSWDLAARTETPLELEWSLCSSGQVPGELNAIHIVGMHHRDRLAPEDVCRRQPCVVGSLSVDVLDQSVRGRHPHDVRHELRRQAKLIGRELSSWDRAVPSPWNIHSHSA